MNTFRSNCSIGSALDLVGDKWSLLIVRDMLISQKHTFKDFESSNESIASNILPKRLRSLDNSGILSKHKLKKNKKANVYLLTPKGYDLIHVLGGFVIWGNTYLKREHPELEDYHIGDNSSEIDTTIELILTKYTEFRNFQLSACV
jgi:DNA-binding HxlR family transcriptional regulator